ncbi:MAG: hypothetical protein OEZ51_14810 [Nitrospinota bacterium]|nr:hypothetical protein [Nitrospinota bacterium]
MKTPIHLLLIVLCSLGLSSCSVIMAMSGEEEPDLKILQAGSSREDVEKQLGEPVQSEPNGSGVRATYEYETGDPPDGRRALAHIFLNLYTIGLYEIVGTAAELGVHSGEDNKITVTYDANGKVEEISEPVPVKQAEATSSSQEAQEGQ